MTLPIFQKDFEYTYQTHRATSDIGKEKLKSLLKVLKSNRIPVLFMPRGKYL